MFKDDTGAAIQAMKCTLKRSFAVALICAFTGSTAYGASALARTANLEQANTTQTPQMNQQQRLKFVTSIRPVALMVEALLPQDLQGFEVQVLVPPQMSPHDFQWKASDLNRLSKASGFFWFGADAEPQFAKATDRLQGVNADLSQSKVTWITFEEDAHELHADQDEHDEHAGHDDHHHGPVDPHIWLSFDQLPVMLEFYAGELKKSIVADGPKVGWDARFIQNQIDGVDARLKAAYDKHKVIADRIDGLKKTWSFTDYIAFHDAFGYLDRAFNVQLKGAFVRNPSDGIAPRQLRKLQSFMAAENIGCVLLEPAADGRSIESQIKNDIPTVDLDILATSLPSGMGLFGFWEYAAEQLQSCFGREASKQEIQTNQSLQIKGVSKDEDRILEKLKKLEDEHKHTQD